MRGRGFRVNHPRHPRKMLEEYSGYKSPGCFDLSGLWQITAARFYVKGELHQGKRTRCGRTFYTDGAGTAEIYFSSANRQAAYRERQERIAGELAFLRGEVSR